MQISDHSRDIRILLQDERTSLLSGKVADMPGLLDRKIALFASLEEAGEAGVEQLSEISGEVIRNQELMEQALQGMKAIIDRIAELKRARDGLETYDKRGQVTMVKSKQSSVERRA